MDMNEKVEVSPGVFKRMGDCTAADLRAAADLGAAADSEVAAGLVRARGEITTSDEATEVLRKPWCYGDVLESEGN